MNKLVRICISCLAISFPQFYSKLNASDLATLTRILVDAQSENASRVMGGQMDYRIKHILKDKNQVEIESKVRWDSQKAFWTFKIFDSSAGVVGKYHDKPLSSAVPEFMFQQGNSLFSFNAHSNTLFETKFEYPNQTSSIFYLFDVLPKTLGQKCCPPFQAQGREWSDLVGSNYSRTLSGSEIKMEKNSNDLITQTRIDANGSKGKIVFSLSFSGYPVEMEFLNAMRPKESSKSLFEWQKINNVTVLKMCKIVRGDIRRGENDANEIFEFVATSINLSKSPLNFSFQSFSNLLPKNTLHVDQIRNKSRVINPTKESRISDKNLEKLSIEIQQKGFAKP